MFSTEWAQFLLSPTPLINVSLKPGAAWYSRLLNSLLHQDLHMITTRDEWPLVYSAWNLQFDGFIIIFYWLTHFFHSQLYLSGPAALRGPVLSRLFVQLVCCCGLSSRPAGQPHPEGAAAEGSTRHQHGQPTCLPASTVHQHPLPGRTIKIKPLKWRLYVSG